LADYFSSVFTPNYTLILPDVNDFPLPSISPISVYVEGVAQLLTNIQSQKASELDNLPARFLKEVANEIALVLTVTFQASLYQGSLPSIWKTAAIVLCDIQALRTSPNTL